MDKLESDPGAVRALAYDVVLNGTELGSGSIRIHRQDIQSIIFKALGMSPEEQQARFGFFLEALQYGTPPHGGIALGLDRIVMILAGADSLREVIPFPKTAKAIDLMMDAPTPVSDKQLKELGDCGGFEEGYLATTMPTVLRSGPYRFYFYSHEPNEPPHVHVDRDDLSAKFWLDPVALARNFGFGARELNTLQSLVEAN